MYNKKNRCTCFFGTCSFNFFQHVQQCNIFLKLHWQIPEISESVWTHPNEPRRIQTHPNVSEQVQTGSTTSKNFEKLPKTSRFFSKKFQRVYFLEKVQFILIFSVRKKLLMEWSQILKKKANPKKSFSI